MTGLQVHYLVASLFLGAFGITKPYSRYYHHLKFLKKSFSLKVQFIQQCRISFYKAFSIHY